MESHRAADAQQLCELQPLLLNPQTPLWESMSVRLIKFLIIRSRSKLNSSKCIYSDRWVHKGHSICREIHPRHKRKNNECFNNHLNWSLFINELILVVLIPLCARQTNQPTTDTEYMTSIVQATTFLTQVVELEPGWGYNQGNVRCI